MAIAKPLSGSDEVISATAVHYYGFSVRETTGTTAATIKIYDDPDSANGTLLDSIQLAAGESAREWYGPNGLRALLGIYVDVTGTVEGSLRVG